MLRKNFMKFESMSELHKELTNIFLLATEDDNFFCCYCKKEGGKKCDLCGLCYYLFDDNNRIDGLPLEKFLQLNYDKREKLEKFADKIFPFFERMEHYEKRSLDFFNKEYEWVLKDYSTATYHTLTLTEIIDSNKEFVKNNPKFFDKDFLKEHPHI